MIVTESLKVKTKIIYTLVFGLLIASISMILLNLAQNSIFAAESTDASYFTFDETTGTITEYSSDGPKDVVIPDEINGVQVTSIGPGQWDSQMGSYSGFIGKYLTSVKFPETLKDIG